MSSKRDVDNLHKLIKNLERMNETLSKIGGRYMQETLKHWNKGESVGGQRFPSLSAGYKKQKTRLGRKAIPDLELSSTLRRSLNMKLTNKGVIIGVRANYASYVAKRNEASGLWGMTEKFRKKILKFLVKELSPA